jgi:hypothetical protein
MADEQEAIAETTGLETATEPEALTVTDEPERIPGPEEVAAEAEGEAETAEEDELEEWEHTDGKTYQVPKALRKHLMLDKDYTQGKQKLSAAEKALEAKQAEAEERLKVTDEELDDRATLRTLERDLKAYSEFSQADWAQFEQQDPLAAQQHWRNYQMLKEQKGEVQSRLETYGKQRTEKADSELKTRIQETLEHAKKSIPGWKPDTIPKLVEFAQQQGIPDNVIQSNWSPKFIDLLHKASLGDQLLKKQTALKPPPVPVAPLATVNGKSTPAARGDLASSDMETYVKLRKQGVGGKPLR